MIRQGITPYKDDWEPQFDELAKQHSAKFRDQMAKLYPYPPTHDPGRSPNPSLHPHSEELVRGWAPVPLLPEGIKQAEHNGELIKRKGGAHGIYTPTLLRSMQSAQATSRASGVPIVEADPAWSTRGWGSMDGKPLKQVLKKMIHLQRDAIHEQPPGGGESTSQYFNRFLPRLHQLMSVHDSSPGLRSVLVNHHSGIKAIEAWFKKGMPPDYSVDLDEFIRHDGEPGDAYGVIRDHRAGWIIRPHDLEGKEPLRDITLTRHGKTAWNGTKGADDEGDKAGKEDKPIASGLSRDEQSQLLAHLQELPRIPGYSRLPSAHRTRLQASRQLLEQRLGKQESSKGALAS